MALSTKTGVIGLDRTIKNLNRAIRSVNGGSKRGVLKAGLYVKKESQKLVPVDKGFLLNSAFIYPIQTLRGFAVYVGYTASYAVFVHENPRAGVTGGMSPSGQRYTKYAQSGQWKFLESVVREDARIIVDIIRIDAGREI